MLTRRVLSSVCVCRYDFSLQYTRNTGFNMTRFSFRHCLIHTQNFESAIKSIKCILNLTELNRAGYCYQVINPRVTSPTS